MLQNAERWVSWQARHFCNSHDLATDRGLDNAIQEAATGSARLNDALDRRFFLSSLCAATGLTEEELSGRLRQQEQVMTLQRVKNTLQITLAKCVLSAGLRKLRFVLLVDDESRCQS